jgi:hypothetical protein
MFMLFFQGHHQRPLEFYRMQSVRSMTGPAPAEADGDMRGQEGVADARDQGFHVLARSAADQYGEFVATNASKAVIRTRPLPPR